MLNVLAVIAISIAPPPVMRPDTPPPLPIAVERLAQLKTREDIVASSLLPDGSRPPAHLELPVLANSNDVVGYMLEHYPPQLRDRYPAEMPWAWIFIDENGRATEARMVKSSGLPAFDSLALAALRVARFTPARLNGKSTGLWVPYPVQTSYQGLAERAQKEKDPTDRPVFTPYTVKPELLNRDEVSRALVRNYPPQLRDAGTGGEVMMWLLVDAGGSTRKNLVKTSSGIPDLDQAAQAVATTMRWKPALNRDQPVSVWIAVPIVFKSNGAQLKR